jgi:hypothetical protein
MTERQVVKGIKKNSFLNCDVEISFKRYDVNVLSGCITAACFAVVSL